MNSQTESFFCIRCWSRCEATIEVLEDAVVIHQGKLCDNGLAFLRERYSGSRIIHDGGEQA